MLLTAFSVLLKWFGYFVGIYLIGLNGTYILFNLLAFFRMKTYLNQLQIVEMKSAFKSSFYPEISVLVPAYNEVQSIADTVHSLMQLEYPEFEVIVINDGSTDHSLQVLIDTFELVPLPIVFDTKVPCQPIHAIYLSRSESRLVVIDKENGGKADSLNAGINVSRYPLFCSIDADSLLERDCLLKVVNPMIQDSRVIGVGGIIRIANGCNVQYGSVTRIGIPNGILERFQVMEYLRAFLFGRVGLDSLNATLVISGAFGLFRKDPVMHIGGYRVGCIGEDMEMVARLHKMMLQTKQPYRITFIPDPVCWTQAPDNWRVWVRQRNRWQRGLADTLFQHLDMLFNPRYKMIGMFAMPYFMFFELLSPIVESMGYIIVPLGFALGLLDPVSFVLFMTAMVFLGLILSIGSLILEEMAFHRYPNTRDILILFMISILENFGYRQIHSFVRLKGLLDYALGKKQWGVMVRTGFQTADRQTSDILKT